MTSYSDSVLWAGTVRSKPFEERLIAARAGGFSEMSLFPLDYQRFTSQGLSAQDMQVMMDEHGVKITTLDPFSRWLPTWEPPAGMSEADLAFMAFSEDEFFRMGSSLGIQSMTVIEPFGHRVVLEEAVESFAQICDRAAEEGWRVHLEFIPTTSISDLATAWEIVRQANRLNGGLVFDTWHYFRGRPDHELLARIPGDRIFVVQLSDAKTEVQGSLAIDMLHHRLPLGEGDFDLCTVLRLLEQTGGLTSVGPELFSDTFDALPAEDAGRRAGDNLRSYLKTVLTPKE